MYNECTFKLASERDVMNSRDEQLDADRRDTRPAGAWGAAPVTEGHNDRWPVRRKEVVTDAGRAEGSDSAVAGGLRPHQHPTGR